MNKLNNQRFIPSLCIRFHSRSTREGTPDVHHPQTGRPVFPGPQRGERILHPFPWILSARASLLHHGHEAGATQPGDELSGHHVREASHRGSGAAHPEGMINNNNLPHLYGTCKSYTVPLMVYDIQWMFVLQPSQMLL